MIYELQSKKPLIHLINLIFMNMKKNILVNNQFNTFLS